MITLANTHFNLVISEHGAEMQSLKSKHTGIEYLWDGDPTYWPRRAPILFPMSGPTKDDTISVDGKNYHMPNNGFARDLDYTLVSQTESTATFVLEDSEATRTENYPFGFKITVQYTLNDESVSIKTTIESKTDGMRFVYALHPAFRLNINADAKIDDYMLSFSDAEHVEKVVKVGNFFDAKTQTLFSGKLYKLTSDELNQGALRFKDLKSKSVSLLCDLGNHGVELALGDLRTLVVWSPENKKAPFVCVEPMYSFGDASRPADLASMDGLVTLKEGQKKTFSNTIRPF